MNLWIILVFQLVVLGFHENGFSAHGQTGSNEAEITDRINWPEFLEQHNMIWKKVPVDWTASPYLGNGWMGTMIYRNGQEKKHQLRIDVHHAGVQDHRFGDGTFMEARLPVGYFIIDAVGEIISCDLRLSLWDAELSGSVTTSEGSFDLLSMVHSEEMLLYVKVTPKGGEGSLEIRFHPLEAISPRAQPEAGRSRPGDYFDNPVPELYEKGLVKVCRQPLLVKGEHATAWQITGEVTRELWVSVAHSFPGNTSVEEAVQTVIKAQETGFETLFASHCNWWHAYYPASFVSLPDIHWEGFYWNQMYKMGSATRADRCLIDNQGPWLQSTPWPHATWNLNVQLIYWPFIHLAISGRRSPFPGAFLTRGRSCGKMYSLKNSHLIPML